MAQKSSTFIKITNQQVWDKLVVIEEKLDSYSSSAKATRKIAVSALGISTFIAGALIVQAVGG